MASGGTRNQSPPAACGEAPEKTGPGSSQRPCGRRTVGDRQVLTRKSIGLGVRKPRETGRALERLPGQIVQASTSGLRHPTGPSPGHPDPTAGRAEGGRQPPHGRLPAAATGAEL